MLQNVVQEGNGIPPSATGLPSLVCRRQFKADPDAAVGFQMLFRREMAGHNAWARCLGPKLRTESRRHAGGLDG